MSNNHLFHKAAIALSHPLSLSAMLILFLNDHFLRIYWPSWLTGKLGDFAWLFFFPFVMVMLLASLWPAQLRRFKDLPALSAFGLLGLIFTLAKTMPAFHNLLIRNLEAALGMPITWRLDPTDLIALPSLLAAWWLWIRTPALPAPRLRPTWALVSLAALLTIANSGQPDSGVNACGYYKGQVITSGQYILLYASQDGGESWQQMQYPDEKIEWGGLNLENWTKITPPVEPGVLLRCKSGENIEVSTDGGSTWNTEYRTGDKAQLTDAYYNKTSRNTIWLESPRDACVDQSTGNIIFTMGFEGVLVRRPGGQYIRVAIGPYAPVRASPQMIWLLLNNELALSVILGGLAVATLGRRWYRSDSHKFGLAGLWAGWGFIAVVWKPAFQGSDEAMLGYLGTIVLALFTLPFALDAFFHCGVSSPGQLPKMLLVLIGCMILYCLPLILWALNIIPDYTLAVLISILLCLGLLVWQDRAMHRLPAEDVDQMTRGYAISGRVMKAGKWIMLAMVILIVILAILTIEGDIHTVDSLEKVSIATYAGLGVFIIGYVTYLVGLFLRTWDIRKQRQKAKELPPASM